MSDGINTNNTILKPLVFVLLDTLFPETFSASLFTGDMPVSRKIQKLFFLCIQIKAQ
jgi:hypothetical protein